MNAQQHNVLLRPTSFEDITPLPKKTSLEQAINAKWRAQETATVESLLQFTDISNELDQKIYQLAFDLSQHLRENNKASGKAGIVQGLLQEFSLSSQEGIALMCLAEALLRIPDKATRDQLIRDKIGQGNWKEHIGQSGLVFVNAAAWGLMLTGKIVTPQTGKSMSSILTSILARSGQGIIRKAVDVAMRMMGEQFVTGETIQSALTKSKALENEGFLYSYDMLGEAALTDHDADRYMKDYVNAIHAIGQSSKNKGVYDSAGISIKLSALHPRYQRAQIERVHAELYPKILELALLAQKYDIGLNIDAEESERLEMSLELLERLCFEPQLKGWNGVGFVIQAYQKRCFELVDYLVDLGTRSEKRLMIRLVKGAYWDSEIKKAQVEGLNDYPVFTRKVYTDLSYIACAKKLLAAPKQIYPQFATHNAQTLATIYELGGADAYTKHQYEFQCLHGMGEPLYKKVVRQFGIPCRIYAPVGNHETLLAYLVRRLLENGANTSFVNRISDKAIQIDELIRSPIAEIRELAEKEHGIGQKHPAIPLPQDLYGTGRTNSVGFDLANDTRLSELNEISKQYHEHQWVSTPLIANHTELAEHTKQAVTNPAQHQDIVGHVIESSEQDVELALQQAEAAQHAWATTPIATRAQALETAANHMESRLLELLVLLCRESGKTYANAIAEVREAVDFLRYYAKQVRSLDPAQPTQPLGTVLCISPWNFPLAIFTGQVAAALVMGNCVIAKPAEQTPLVAYEAIQMLHAAGIPENALQFLPGDGATVGAKLSADARIHGIMFTGSTEVAKILQKTVAKRVTPHGQPVTLIAETGGQNAMIVDSSALTEQVVLDTVSSAFDSAGQRCSALRILCLQEDSAQPVLTMLKGAMRELRLGNPHFLNTDVGPVIDLEAQQTIQRHIDKMKGKGYAVHQHTPANQDQVFQDGTFIAPTLIELPHLDDLEREVFGPVLHVITYKQHQLDQLIQQINDKGYGLTMGIHTRIDETIQKVIQQSEVGNLYVNRNIVGAVVGVQPFGGEGLSGTGPKAGGPLYVHRLAEANSFQHTETPFAVKQQITAAPSHYFEHFNVFKAWVKDTFSDLDVSKHQPFMVGQTYELQGPTGESNQYTMQPRHRVLSLAHTEQEYIDQLLAIFSVNARPVIKKGSAFFEKYLNQMPTVIKQHIEMIDQLDHAGFDAVLHHGSTEQLLALQHEIALHQGAIVSIHQLAPHSRDIPIERLVIEHAVSINTTAAGGNASLMTM
ncbi:trifunctional transcriptional regulator/proline dehydrogenase/L-glutamate gamma-semialdehyde dehydrogenase [Acinetobacter apis]|uniref:Bifunctional protein PutA n=1 Tax=Acinetobacter apis TaxID=1229165 RepID=A0A217EFF6_9GAMM|nr:trifunctional transcriptional regulator/proline dehydrogenase/L-glutamate gamma-semialdehyde dehydrogenase [Acinetobacter apis]SNQ29084.1 L-proline dehydrogenase /delta-1-pyrroline-5-carboxylate dehydrogenase [Acinetobacter apis]